MPVRTPERRPRVPTGPRGNLSPKPSAEGMRSRGGGSRRADDRRPDGREGAWLGAVLEPLELERRLLEQLLGAAVRKAAGGDIPVRQLRQVLKAPERRALAGVDVLQEQVA